MTKFRKALTTYDDFYEMMADDIRMDSFREAIFSKVSKGDVVVDLGSGLGILGFWALKAGASKVYAIEKSDAIELAKDLAAKNGLEDRIVFLNSESKACDIPEKVDLIISETLGSFGIEENTIEFTMDIRNRFLKTGGRVLPQALNVYLAPCTNPSAFEKQKSWSGIKDLDFEIVSDRMSSKMSVEEIHECQLMADPQIFTRLNFHDVKEATIETKMVFAITKPGQIHGLAGWFACDLDGEIVIATSPESPKTHWKQAYFPFREALSVTEKDFLEVTMKCEPKEDGTDNQMISYEYRCSQVSE